MGVELFGRLDCNVTPCQGLGEHAHFQNFGMAFLTLFRVATGDNWNGIMKDTLDDEHCDHGDDCVNNCCISPIIAPIFFVIFVLMAQFVLVNVVVAVLMKHLEESHKQLEDEQDLDAQLEREFVEKQERTERELYLALQADQECQSQKKQLYKVHSLPSNFIYSPPEAKVSVKIENSKTTTPPSPTPLPASIQSSQKPLRYIEEVTDIYSIGSASDESQHQQQREEETNKNITKNEPSSFLLVPQQKELLQRSGSVKNILRKQLSMDIHEESSVLLTVPEIQKHGSKNASRYTKT